MECYISPICPHEERKHIYITNSLRMRTLSAHFHFWMSYIYIYIYDIILQAVMINDSLILNHMFIICITFCSYFAGILYSEYEKKILNNYITFFLPGICSYLRPYIINDFTHIILVIIQSTAAVK